MTANTYKPEQITALYARLSQEDALDGDSNSIVNHLFCAVLNVIQTFPLILRRHIFQIDNHRIEIEENVDRFAGNFYHRAFSDGDSTT